MMPVTTQGSLTRSVNLFPIHLTKPVPDDLTLIKGIGPSRQRWLREVYQVQTFADLAGLSLDEIEVQLKVTGQVVSRRHIHHWLADARQLAASQYLLYLQQSKLFHIHAASQPVQPQPSDHANQPEAWRPFASFVVELQTQVNEALENEMRTKVHHIETDTCATWPGVVSEQLCRWMLEQLGDEFRSNAQLESGPVMSPTATLPSLPSSPIAAGVSQPTTPAKITQIQVFQPPTAETPVGMGPVDQPFPTFIQGDAPFRLGLTFEINNLAGADIAADQVAVQLQTQVYDLSTGTTMQFSDTTALLSVAEQARQTVLLPVSHLSQGIYRLKLQAVLEAPSPISIRATVPLLQVA